MPNYPLFQQGVNFEILHNQMNEQVD